MATNVPLTGFFIGEDWTITDIIKDGSGALLDLSSFSLVFTVVKVQGGPALIQKTTAAGIVISNQTTNKGQCVVTVLALDTAGFREGLYWWSISRVDAGGNTNLSNGPMPLQKRS